MVRMLDGRPGGVRQDNSWIRRGPGIAGTRRGIRQFSGKQLHDRDGIAGAPLLRQFPAAHSRVQELLQYIQIRATRANECSSAIHRGTRRAEEQWDLSPSG